MTETPEPYVPESDERVILARIETKLDTVISQTGDHETRIRKVEKVIWVAAGAAGIGGGAVSQVLGNLGNLGVPVDPTVVDHLINVAGLVMR
jgi:hypothetical protein